MARIFDPEGRETRALDSLVRLEGKHVLDIGCGEGRTARRMARIAASVTGVDPDSERIVAARAWPPEPGAAKCTYLDADILTLDLPPASFDVAIFSRSL